MSPELDYLEAMPDSMIAECSGEADVIALCRKKRECLFKDSLLQTMYPEFYAENFMKYPVLYISLSESLSTFIAKQYGKYLLLIDEYDIPFITIHLAKWSDEDKQAALDVMKTLFQKMLKDNKYLLKGLLFGVFEIPLTEMGSGANNIKDIRMIPAEESDIQGSILTAAHPHSGCGMDALTDSF
ncbi:hypothetical protein H4S02_011305, partial [Coemansia sp. RSA 2611]